MNLYRYSRPDLFVGTYFDVQHNITAMQDVRLERGSRCRIPEFSFRFSGAGCLQINAQTVAKENAAIPWLYNTYPLGR